MMIKREDAKTMFRDDVDSYGKPKRIMTKLDKIYDTIGSCGECEHFNDRYKKKDIFFIDGNLHKPTHFCGYFERKDT